MIGYRFIPSWDRKPEVGETLPNSFVWEGDERTDQELPGTSAFASMADFAEYAKYSHGNGWIVTIEGDKWHRGDLPGEILIEDATVVAVAEW